MEINIATEEQNLKTRVEAALNSIRPYLEADGGNVVVKEVTEDHIAVLELVGACGSCPMSTMTFKAGLEEAILRSVPEIKKVVALNLTPAF
ncbi:MAG: NifU family protein [Spirosomaceae bacterium]|jgi:Fe-S cluster biogenesis protein NfuA|nr:NifU family protein [Spirosomataceae bacterium]